MKTKIIALLIILTAFAAAPLRADESGQGMVQLELKIMQIELDVALKQFEKVSTALAEAALETRLINRQDRSDEQIKVEMSKAEQKMTVLSEMKDRLREEIMKRGAEIEAIRRRSGLPATEPENKPKVR